MTAISWKTGTSGTWTTGANWSTGNVPGIGDSVTIAAAGTYTVTVAAATSVSAGTLALSAAGATLDDLGTLNLGGTFSVAAGTFILDTGGMLSGGTLRITPTTGIVSYLGGTLSNVAVQGTLDLSAATCLVTEIGGIAFAGATGTGAGAIKLTGAGSSLSQSGSGTLNTATVTIGSATGDTLTALDSAGAGVLTLGGALLLNDTTGNSVLSDAGGSGDGIVNRGTISSASSTTGTASLAISGASLTNAGTFIVSNTSSLAAAGTASLAVVGTDTISDATVTNTGSIALGPVAAAASTSKTVYTATSTDLLAIGGASFSNSGTVSVAASATTTATGGATASGSVTISDTTATNTGLISLSTSATSTTSGTVAGGSAAATASLVISSGSFTNAGTIALSTSSTATNTGTGKIGKASGTDKLTISSASFTNAGLISLGAATSAKSEALKIGANAVAASGTIAAAAATSWTNTGTINAAGGTVSLLGSFTLGTFNHAGASVLIGGYDNNVGSTLTVGGSAGAITAGNGLNSSGQVIQGGVITGGTIVDQGLGLVNNYDTLDGVTYQGTLAIDQAGSNVSIYDGITLQGLGGTGPGAITIGGNIVDTSSTGYSTYFYTYGNTTLDNATITMGSNNTSYTHKGVTTTVYNSSYIDVSEYVSNSGGTITPGVLTLGSHLTLTEASIAHYVQLSNFAADPDTVWTQTPYAAGDAITNNGSFVLNSATGDMDVQAQNFTNNGNIALSNGGTFEVDTYNQFVNTGLITATGGALLIGTNATGPAGTQTVIGTSSGGTATITTFQTTSFTNTGTVVASGAHVELGGTLTNGWLSNFMATGGQTYVQQYAYAQDAGATLQTGSGASGVSNQLVLGGTIIGGTIQDSGSGLVAAGGTLDGVTYQGNLDPLSEASYKATYIDIKDGITLVGANGTGAGTVTLTGGVNLLGEGNITLGNAAISLGAAAGGAVALGEDADYHGTFTLGAGVSLTTTGNGATLASGTGAADAFTNAGTILVASSLSITGNAFANTGQVSILGSEVVSDTASLTTNGGYIFDFGGTLSAAALTNAAGALISGSGIVSLSAGGTLVNGGSIEASGGTLTIGSATSGGYLDVASGTLVLSGAATGGLLELETAATVVFDQAASVRDTIDSAVAGDVVDLASTSVTAAQIVGGTLAVTLAGGTVLDYALGGGVTGETVAVGSDRNGGSDVTFYNLAAASVVPTSFTFGNVHVGGTDTGTLSVTNTDSGQYSEKLDGSVGNATGSATASGQFAGLAPGGTDGTDLTVGLSTATAGTLTGAAVVTLSSDGAGVDGNAATVIGTQTVQVSGAVYAYAAPTGVPGTVALGAVRVGGSLTGSFTLGDGSSASAYQESLVYGLSGGAGSASGTIASGGSAALALSLGSSVSGSFSTTETLGLTSTGVGTSGLADTSLGSDTLTVTGRVFQTASAGFGTLALSLGNVHQGDTATASVGVTNTATGALVDHLLVSGGGASGAFSGGTSSLNLASGASGSLAIGLSTASSGSYGGSLVVGLTSHDLTLSDLSLAPQTITLTGAVFAYAAPVVGGTTLDLGAVRTGGSLSGSISLADGSTASAYQESLVYALSGVASAGGTIVSGGATSLGVTLSTASSGTITSTGSLSLVSTGVGTSGLADTALPGDAVSVTGTVYQAAAASLSGTTVSFGNVHVGDTASGTLSVTNTASGALVDQLLASAAETGAGFSGSGSLALASGATGSIAVSLNTGTAGGYSGSIAVGLTSHDGALADLSLAPQTVSLSGAVYAYAAPVVGGTTLDLGAVRTGGSLSGSISLADGSTASAYQESLVYALSGVASAGGTIVSGGATSLGVTLSTASSGTITSTGSLSLVSTGVGTSGLADTALPGDAVSVTGTVYQAAAASLSGTTVSFGNVHVGDTASGTLSVTNTASGALVDQLLASAAETGAGFSGSGSLALASGATGSIAVSLNTGTAGGYSGSIAVGLTSHDGALADLSLAPQTVSLSGAVYAYAAPVVGGTTLDLGAVRTGGSLSGSISLADGSTASAYQESLVYALSGVASAGGTIVSGGATSLGVTLSTASSGTITSTGSLSLVSTGVGTSGLADTALPGDAVSVTGTVYQAAVAQLASTTVDFGIVHVGDTALESLGLTNGATGALVDELLASLSGTSGAFSAGGSLTLGAGQSGTIGVGLATGSAGVFTGDLYLALASHDSALADLALASQIIDFTGTVDNYATLGIAAAAGPASLSGSGTAATLSFGTVSLGGSGSETISVFNGATGQADLLSGSITAHGGANFTNSGLGSFSGLGAGQATSQLGVALTATQSGSYSETLVVTGVGGNASGYSGAVGSETITVTGTVVGSYTLTTGHDTISAGNGTDTIYAAANTLSSGDSIAAGGGANTLALTGSGNFDLALPSTLSGIGTVTVAESASGTTTVTLRNNTSAAVDVGSVAGGSITILGAANGDVIDLGSGTDTITLGGKSETVNGGSGTDTFDVTAKTIAAAIHGGTGTNLLDVTGTGTVTMGASITGSFASATLLAGGTTFTANAQHGLAIVATTGTDTIRVGDASQSVTGPATVHVLATTATAGALISGVHAGSTLELVNGGPAALNANTTGITVTLDKASNLTLSKMGAITAIGSAGNDVITAGAQGQTLTGGAGTDTLVGYSGFGDIFSDTMAGLGGDKIMNFGGTDTIDITDLRGPVTETYTYAGGYTTVDVSGSAGSVSILLKGSYSAANLGFGGDGHGTVISYTGH